MELNKGTVDLNYVKVASRRKTFDLQVKVMFKVLEHLSFARNLLNFL